MSEAMLDGLGACQPPLQPAVAQCSAIDVVVVVAPGRRGARTSASG